MVGAVLAADEGSDITVGAVDPVDLRRLVQLGELSLQPRAQAAWAVVVENEPRVGGGSRIVWQQRDFGQTTQHDQIAVAAGSDSNQRRPRPCVDQPAARAPVEHNRGAVGRIDQA